jgi:hypothetical protein
VSNKQGSTPWPWLVPRPRHLFEHLPLQYQWEFTRRHPYYIMFWNPAEWDFLDQVGSTGLQNSVHECRALILAQIGVGTSTIPPERDWQEIEPGEEWSAWTSGAMRRLSILSLVVALADSSSKDTLKSLGFLFWELSQLDESNSQEKYRWFKKVIEGEFPGFDEYLPELIVSIQPSSTKDAIANAAMEIVREARAASGRPETRIRADKLDSYLQVWDLREGWHEGLYDPSRARKLKEIAAETGLRVTTVRDQYQAAFSWITGQEYSPEMWFRLFGGFQMLGLIGSGDGPKPRRAGRTRSVAGLNESAISGNTAILSLIESSDSASILNEDDNPDILRLIQNGAPVDEIVNRFGLDPENAVTAITEYRARLDESL